MGVPEDKVVVIGAGMGGLAAAMRLAHAGFDVTIADRNPWAGGKMRTVPSAAGPIDAGPTVLTMRDVFDALFEDTGSALDAHVNLEAEPLLARHVWPDGSMLDLHADAEASETAIRAFAGPAEAAAFVRFSEETARLFEAFDAPMMRAARPRIQALAGAAMRDPSLWPALGPFQTLARRLARHFEDPRLRQLFGRYATYVGGSPYDSPAVLGLIWQAEARGVWRVTGGMHRLAAAMAKRAEDLGARVLLGNGVRRIEVQAGSIRGVQLEDGTRLPARQVVMAGDPRALAAGLLGNHVSPAIRPPNAEPRSLSANVWAFAARPSGVDLAHHTVFFGHDPRTEFDPLRRGTLPEDPTLYVCAEDRGTGRTPPALERFEIIMNAPPLPRGQSRDLATCRKRTFPVLKARGLVFSPEPPDDALTTPMGFEAISPGSLGSLYGRSPHGLMAAFQRPHARTAVPGLYLAGGGAHPGAGVPMATLSGRHAAAAIETDRTLRSKSRRTAMLGGTSTASRTTGAAPSR
ncbi:MAG: 1-hydroxycarotenoid 3,4-desaturase CrtD [Pseudomonadota bacterium]